MRLSSFIVLHPSLFSFFVVTLFYRSSAFAERLKHTDVEAANFLFFLPAAPCANATITCLGSFKP
ncbi:hypothetical protein B0H14DRAFT_2689603 [Mycena olivaceomarginata]|nr:hypothetical protein B0H14DRAFT_2689603 [Mycena olivaceomarginata]